MADRKLLELLDEGVTAWNAWRATHPEVVPSLYQANLSRRTLTGINFSAADLREVDLTGANLAAASLIDANLTYARLDGVRFAAADLTRANLAGASLAGCDLSNATLAGTLLTNIDLSVAFGLDFCRHEQPSAIDIASLQKSGGKIPPSFLRAVGLPQLFIEYLPTLLSSPLEFYSCFLSYSMADQDFAKRLYDELQKIGVRVWFAPKDLRAGDKIRSRIDESIRSHDKLLVVLSESAIRSPWVQKEVETALDRERLEQRVVLFPVTIDSAVFRAPEFWLHEVRTRVIGDFRDWHDYSVFAAAVARLSRDLALTSAVEKTGAK